MSDELPIFEFVVGDQLPKYRLQVRDRQNNNAPLNCSASTVTASMRLREAGAEETLAEIALTKLDGGWDGWWLLTFPDDLTLSAGRYEGQISVSFDGDVQTLRQKPKWRVHERFAEVES